MLKTLMRLTALAVLFEKLAGQHRRPAPRPHATMSREEMLRIYGIPGEELLKHMGNFEFAPGAVDEMRAAVDAISECESEGAD